MAFFPLKDLLPMMNKPVTSGCAHVVANYSRGMIVTTLQSIVWCYLQKCHMTWFVSISVGMSGTI